ncbi:3539_t:CDS:1, partial [Acaulospora colombiana]
HYKGQIFFDEGVSDEVFEQAAYQGSGHTRTHNDEDGILEQANTGGYSAFAEIEKLGETLDDGLLYVQSATPHWHDPSQWYKCSLYLYAVPGR